SLPPVARHEAKAKRRCRAGGRGDCRYVRQLKFKLAVKSSMRPRIMMLKGTVIRSSVSSAVPRSTACGTWLGHINIRPFSAGMMMKSELSSFFAVYLGSKFFVNLRDEANSVGPQLMGVLI